MRKKLYLPRNWDYVWLRIGCVTYTIVVSFEFENNHKSMFFKKKPIQNTIMLITNYSLELLYN